MMQAERISLDTAYYRLIDLGAPIKPIPEFIKQLIFYHKRLYGNVDEASRLAAEYEIGRMELYSIGAEQRWKSIVGHLHEARKQICCCYCGRNENKVDDE